MKEQNKPIAIVGIGCRYPGEASSPEKFWELMVNKKDAIVDVPSDRWDQRKFYDGGENKPGKTRVVQGGFLQENIKEFDPLFFGVSPVEAQSMDPQIRLLLEVAYEALEDSGVTLESIRGSKTGVFVGGFTIDNYLTQASQENRHLINSHTSLGAPITMLSNRISYSFDLKGPSLSIDTACSSSLVATHYACQSIWNGESEMALVGGVNVMLSPQTFILMSQGQFLSKHGRCKAFDSDAGGYVRGEGAGVLVLKPYDQALKDGDRIYAMIQGTGVNQDGQTNGITVPNGDSQAALMEQIYKDNDIDVNNINYIEAHGTGTQIGDPIEFGAINKVMSKNRTVSDKLFVGSVKSNIGHLEAGAGVAGLIKATLCLYNNKVPANLHFNTPNPALNYDESVLKVATSLEPLPESDESYASVNSFGYGGTNAHVILKQIKTEEVDTKPELKKENNIVFPVTAKSKSSLKERITDYRKYLQKNTNTFEEVFGNIAHRRSFHSERLAVFATSTDDLIDKLEAYEEDIAVRGISEGSALSKKPEVVYVYTGMGPQWWKMGRELMEKEPLFLEVLEECDRHFKKISDWSILEELRKPEETSIIKETYVAQTANFILQVGLTRLLEHYGVRPNAVVGHSVGEVTSQYISGALSLEDALLISYHRSRLQHTTAGKGGMLAVGLSEVELKDILKDYDDVSIAAINSNKAVTLAGEFESLDELAQKFESLGVFHRKLEVAVPYHSPVMDPIKDELLESLSSIKGKETAVDLYSTVSARKISGTEIDNQYWWKNVRESVRFAETYETLMKDDYKVFVEIGPHPVLKNSMIECSEYNKDYHFIQTLNRKHPEQLNFYENLAALFTLGYPLQWDRWVEKPNQLTLPPYAWERKDYWIESKKSLENKIGREGNNFLNTQIDAPTKTFKAELNDHFFPFLKDHIIQGKVVFPGTGYVAAAIALHQNETGKDDFFSLEKIKFHQMLTLSETEVQHLYIALDQASNQFIIHNKEEGDDTPWFKRASGKCVFGAFTNEQPSLDLEALAAKMDTSLTKEHVYELLTGAKLMYGPYFNGVISIMHNGQEALTKIQGCEAIQKEDNGHFIHPGLLDSCFQSIIAFVENEAVSYVPVSIGRIKCYSSPGTEFMCYTQLKSATSDTMMVDITLCDAAGQVMMKIENVNFQEIADNSAVSDDFPNNCFYTVQWAEEDIKAAFELTEETDKINLVITGDYANTLPLVDQLNGEVLVLQPGTDLRELGDNHYEISLDDLSTVAELLNEYTPANIELFYFSELQSGIDKSTITTEESIDHINPLLNMIRYFSDAFPREFILNLITQGGQVVHDEDRIQHLGTAIFHGLGRLMSNEFPSWNVRLIDFEANKKGIISYDAWKIALAQINANKRSFEEIAIRDNVLYKKVMRKHEKEGTQKIIETVSFKEVPLELVAPEFSDLKSLYFAPMERREPEENEIEILIENTSINFKDYLKVTNKISKEALEGTNSKDAIGLDCSGIVTKVGKGVTRFKVGDKVIAAPPGAFKSYVTVDVDLVGECPVTLENTGSHVITAYLTAIYCLENKANLRKGQKVLIHNASGGVGLAAINYANLVGAEIFATAGSEEKRDYLRSLGIKHVFNSRDLDFAGEITEITGGKGIDVVLSSLTGEMLHQSLSVLAPFGTYLEIGKMSAVDDIPLPMKIFNKNLSFISIDLDQLGLDKPEEVSGLMEVMKNYVDSGQLPPLPTTVFSPREIAEAFALIEQGKHIGKVVINFKDESIEVEKQEEALFQNDKSYVVTGGTQGLGLEIADWMVSKGTKDLILLSRSGDKDPNVRKKIEGFRKRGSNVHVYAVDISDQQAMKTWYTAVKRELPPIAGIFHCAMVLDDGFLLDMNDDRFRKVLKPKVDGTLNLHDLTEKTELDFFVMFSSLSSQTGHLGQANYIIANTILDSFAYYRRDRGLPATTVNLGVLGESGVISRDDELKKMVMDFGIKSFTNEEVLLGIEQIVRTKPVHIGFFDVDWELMEKSFKSSKSSLFEELIHENIGLNSLLNPEQSKNWDKIMSLESMERQALVVDLLTEELAQILKMPKESIPSDKGINFLGVDSILSVQLIRAINDQLAIELSPMDFTSGSNLKQLAKIIIEKIANTFPDEVAL